MSEPTLPSSGVSRRSLALGVAWATPLVVVGAPPAFAGTSQCLVTGSVQVSANEILPMRAVCVDQSQQPKPASIYENYGQVRLPRYLEICNCQQKPAWFRWRETDTLDHFQIEIDGVHNDQNSSGQGYREPFYLDSFGGTGGCKRYALTYRTSQPRPTTSNPANVTITFTLQTLNNTTGQWEGVQTLKVSGTVWRTTDTNVNFNSCPSTRSAAAPVTEKAAPAAKAPAASAEGATPAAETPAPAAKTPAPAAKAAKSEAAAAKAPAASGD